MHIYLYMYLSHHNKPVYKNNVLKSKWAILLRNIFVIVVKPISTVILSIYIGHKDPELHHIITVTS